AVSTGEATPHKNGQDLCRRVTDRASAVLGPGRVCGHATCIALSPKSNESWRLMLQPVRTAPLSLTAYKDCADPAMLAQAKAVAAWLHGLRVVHINATPDGGGVAEILRSLVPLLRDLGLDAQWYVLPPDDDFFAVTKQLHNWLQGQPGEL